MSEHTDLILMTEGYTDTPKEISIIFQGCVEPETMEAVVEGMYDSFNEHTGIVAMIDFFDDNGGELLNIEAGRYRDTPPKDAAEEYIIALVPEEMNQEGVILSRKDNNGDWEDVAQID